MNLDARAGTPRLPDAPARTARSQPDAVVLAELERALPRTSVVTDPDVMDAYRRDQAPFAAAGMPLAVVTPNSAAEVQAVMRVAATHHVPVVPRGAGSGLSGGANAVDGCLVLSTARMNRTLEIDRISLLAVVEPGVVTADLANAAAESGLFYPPDPVSAAFCTIGGNIATNAVNHAHAVGLGPPRNLRPSPGAPRWQ